MLVVDDDDGVRDALVLLLEDDYVVLAAEDGEAALSLVRASAPDLVISDVFMPRLDGLGLLRALKQDRGTADVPVLLISANPREESLMAGIEAGADDYLVKPVAPHDLLVRVSANLRVAKMRREASTALARSEERYRAIVESQAEMVCRFRPDGTILFANGAYARTRGSTPEALQAVSFWEFINEEDRPAVRAMLASLRVDAPEVRIENRLETAGGPRWTMWTNRGLDFDDEGRATEIQATGIDITERRRAEEALRASEERFRTLADNISQFAWMADKAGALFWYNRRWYDFTGTTFAQMQGWGWVGVHHPDHVDRVAAHFKDCIQSGEPWEDTFPLRARDGSYRWFLSRALPIRDDDGQIVRWFGTNTDVTEQRAAEEALRDSDRRKDEFLATLAHELRNPLAPLRNGLHILRLPSASTASVEDARAMMERQLEHMVRLIDDLLDVSRISRGKVTLRRRRVALADIVRQAVETSLPTIEGAHHTLTVEVPEGPLDIDADVTRMAQVFANLLNNASKFTPEAGHLRLSVERANEQAVIRVCDDGVGIPAHMLVSIFDIFTQVERAPERSQGGLGIGLSLVKGLVDMHGGSVEARSEGPGLGAELIVRLPLLRPAEGHGAPVETAPPLETDSRRRILVVDDNRDAAISMAMMLELMGNETRTAHDGLEAIEAARAFQPDLVLLDIGMPKLNGYDAARRIRDQPWGRDMVLVAVTGWGQDDDRRRSQEAGFNHHMVKPVEPSALEGLLAGLGSASPARV